MTFPGGSEGKDSACNVENPGSIPGSGRSPGEGNGNAFRYPCLEKSMDGGAWQAYSPWGRKESDTTERLHLILDPGGTLSDRVPICSCAMV